MSWTSVIAIISSSFLLTCCSGDGTEQGAGDESPTSVVSTISKTGRKPFKRLPKVIGRSTAQLEEEERQRQAAEADAGSLEAPAEPVALDKSLAENPSSIAFVKGVVENLTHGSIEIQLDNRETIVVSAGSGSRPFQFVTAKTQGSPYLVSLLRGPSNPSIPCVIANETGPLETDTIVYVSCEKLLELEVYTPAARMAKGTGGYAQAIGIYSFGSLPLTDYVTWNYDNTKVSIIGSYLFAIENGSSVLSASFSGVVGASYVEVISPDVTSILISPTPLLGAVSDQFSLSATVLFADGSVQVIGSEGSWSVDDGIGNPSGSATLVMDSQSPILVATSLGVGKVHVAFGGLVAERDFAITSKKLSTIEVAPVLVEGFMGSSSQLYATALYDDGTSRSLGNELLWSVSDPSVAAISESGLISFLAMGVTTATVSLGELSSQAHIVVDAATAISIEIDSLSSGIPVGEHLDVTARVVFSDGSMRDVTTAGYWSSSDTSVISVSNALGSKGRISALAIGSASVSFSYDGLSKGVIVLADSAAISSVSIAPSSPMISSGVNISLNAMVSFANGSSLEMTDSCIWSSANSELVSFYNTEGSYGVLNNLSSSASTISVGVSVDCDGVIGQTTVIITPAALTSLRISHQQLVLNVFSQIPIRVYGDYDDGGTEDLTDRVVWSSSQSSVAHVSNSLGFKGQVTALTEGVADISASFSGFGAAVSLTVDDSAEESVSLFGNGLTGDYYSIDSWSDLGPDMTSLSQKGVRTDANVNFNWASGSSPLGVGDDFYIKWTGYLKVPETGLYEFRTLSDDGVRLDINGDNLLSNWTLHGATWDSGTINLISGIYFPLALEFFERGGSAVIQLHWVKPGGSLEPVPTEYLFSSDAEVSTEPVLSALDVSPPLLDGMVGDVRAITATGIYSDGSVNDLTTKVVWSVANENVTVAVTAGEAVVDFQGSGETTVKATFDGKSGTSIVHALDPVPESIVVLGGSYLPSGEVIELKALAVCAEGKTVDLTAKASWGVSHSSFLELADPPGHFLGKSSGVANVAASYAGLTGSIDLTVEELTLDRLEISPDTLMLSAGASQVFGVNRVYTDGTIWPLKFCTFSVNDPSNIQLDVSTGLMVHASPILRSTTLTADCAGAIVDTDVFLTSANIVSLQFDLASMVMQPGDIDSVRLMGIFSDGASVEITNLASYTSSNENFLHVSSAAGRRGMMTALDDGLSEITATYSYMTASLPVTVSSSAEPSSVPIGTGLMGSYYRVLNWPGNQPDSATMDLVGSRLDAGVNFNWSTGDSPMGAGDNFYIRWEGKLRATETGSVILSTISDDGVRLTVNNLSVIDNWTYHGATLNSGSVEMVEGEDYDLVLEFFEKGGDAQIELYWQLPSEGRRSIIGTSQLFPE